MTYADYKLGKAIRALSETHARNRDWLGSAEVYLFTRLRNEDVPREVRVHFEEFQAEIERLQAKYGSPAMHIPAALLTEEEVIRLMNLFADVVASWPGSEDMYA
ncbi:MAG TPA: hypothetical protein VEC35_12870 [Noviherbaspirillum sp.]|nr:hypothetical protein [Noviherbaspirillum sp.]